MTQKFSKRRLGKLQYIIPYDIMSKSSYKQPWEMGKGVYDTKLAENSIT